MMVIYSGFRLIVFSVCLFVALSQVCHRRGQRACGTNSFYCYNEITETWTCECEKGFENTDLNRGNVFSCTDRNECTSMTHSCSTNSGCKNSIGSYQCVCSLGFTDVRVVAGRAVCSDLDECASNSPCPAHSTCTNTDGSYKCACDAGFAQGDGLCNDVDECATGAGSNLCWENTYCINTIGSFVCQCNEGFAWNLTTRSCIDVDECIGDPSKDPVCGADTPCVNTIGSYQCRCTDVHSGSVVDSRNCTFISGNASDKPNNYGMKNNQGQTALDTDLSMMPTDDNGVFIGVGVGLGVLLIVGVIVIFIFIIKRQGTQRDTMLHRDMSPLRMSNSTIASSVGGVSGINGSTADVTNTSRHDYYTIAPPVSSAHVTQPHATIPEANPNRGIQANNANVLGVTPLTVANVEMLYSNHKVKKAKLAMKRKKINSPPVAGSANCGTNEEPIVYQMFSEVDESVDSDGNKMVKIGKVNHNSQRLRNPNCPPVSVDNPELCYATIFENSKKDSTSGKRANSPTGIAVQVSMGQGASNYRHIEVKEVVQLSTPSDRRDRYDHLHKESLKRRSQGEVFNHIYERTKPDPNPDNWSSTQPQTLPRLMRNDPDGASPFPYDNAPCATSYPSQTLPRISASASRASRPSPYEDVEIGEFLTNKS